MAGGLGRGNESSSGKRVTKKLIRRFSRPAMNLLSKTFAAWMNLPHLLPGMVSPREGHPDHRKIHPVSGRYGRIHPSTALSAGKISLADHGGVWWMTGTSKPPEDFKEYYKRWAEDPGRALHDHLPGRRSILRT